MFECLGPGVSYIYDMRGVDTLKDIIAELKFNECFMHAVEESRSHSLQETCNNLRDFFNPCNDT